MIPTDWLPPLVLLEDHDGDWELYEEALYEHFCNDFVRSRPEFLGKRVGLKRHPLEKGKEATFWHLISEGAVENERIPDMRRCERIRWPRPIIHGCRSTGVKVWRQQRNGETRIAIALSDFTYVVILAERSGENGSYHLPWTAFCVERERQRLKFQREWEAAKVEV